jgi:hypothetical protein
MCLGGTTNNKRMKSVLVLRATQLLESRTLESFWYTKVWRFRMGTCMDCDGANWRVHGELDSIGNKVDDYLKESTRIKNDPVNVKVSNTPMRNEFEVDVLGLDLRTEPIGETSVLLVSVPRLEIANIAMDLCTTMIGCAGIGVMRRRFESSFETVKMSSTIDF